MGILSINDDLEKTRIPVVTLLVTILCFLMCTASATNNHHQAIHPNENLQQLPFCGDDADRTINRRLLYVTTLDGKLTTLDIINDGNKYWSIDTGPGPLISSSIHRLELTNNGKWVRMIPSLNGILYKFDGETIDPIPMTVDNLLSSSFKFSDDLVISGGKETRSYGISIKNGQILYECSMQGCVNSTDSIPKSSSSSYAGGAGGGGGGNSNHPHKNQNQDNSVIDDIIVIKRQTQTVRAIEPRTGAERWNFSVGHHDLELLQSSECHERSRTESEIKLLQIDIKVIVPEGILIAYYRNEPENILWKYKFDHPIVSVWRIDDKDQIKIIDIFDSTQFMWNNNNDDHQNEKNFFGNMEGLLSPSIYIGMFQKQLYIQESTKLMRVIAKTYTIEQNLLNDESNVPSIPWKPVLATSYLVIRNKNSNAIENKPSEVVKIDDTSMLGIQNDDNSAVTALSVLYASEYVNGNGFFLFTSSDLNKTNTGLCDSQNSTIRNHTTNESTADDYNFEFIDDDTPVKIIIVSLWFWWKEIVVISLTSAVVLNLFLSPRIRHEREVVVIERHIPVPTAIEATEESVILQSRNSQRSLSESNSNDSNGQFKSRFLEDFDLVQCLGKGGFGVVFEVQKKIDDCKYAVKRITLPNKKESRDRVMREVRTLANCEHPNIVRYFHAWIENPPPGWQEEEDKKWLQKDNQSTSIDIETPDDTTTSPTFSNNLKNIKNHKKSGYAGKKLESWVANLNSRNYQNGFNDKSLRYPDDDSDSFIQFKASEDNSANENTGMHNSFNESKKISNKLSMNGIDKRFKPPQIDEDSDNDSSGSFKIEFRELSENSSYKNNSICLNNNNNNNINEIDEKSNSIMTSNSKNITKSTNSIQKLNRHKRPMSLDLSSTGNVIIPIAATPSPQQNKVYLYIQMQLCHKESLKDWLRKNEINMRKPHFCNIFEQITDAVNYVHLKGLIHRDLKPSNIFFSLDNKIKIGDFGLVTDMPTTSTTSTSSSSILFNDNTNQNQNNNFMRRHTQQVGTHLYMSPEQLQGRSYDFKVDIYSLGLIFFELLVYFTTEMERIITLNGLRNGKFPNNFHEKFPQEYKLLNAMLSNEPEKRPTTDEIKIILSKIYNIFYTLKIKLKNNEIDQSN